MFSSTLFSSLVTLVASAVAVSAAPGLTVWTSTSTAHVHGLENLMVTTTIFNTGDETLKLLNDPRGVLDSFPEDSFSITDATGSRPEFDGAKVKYSPEHSASFGDPSAFTVLAPGAFIDVTHDLSAAYDFTLSGPGRYSIEPSNLFTYVGADGTLKDLYATVEDVAEVGLSGTLAVPRFRGKRATYNHCSSDEESKISAAAAHAQTYAGNAYSYLRGISAATPRYTEWFGAYTADRKNTVENHFRLISSHQFSSFTYDCSKSGCRPTWYAYVNPNDFGTIYLCNAFWTAPETGTDSKAGTLVHESSHFTRNGGTDDYEYGQAKCRALARSNPSEAVDNADSHEYFAENNPFLAFTPSSLHMQ